MLNQDTGKEASFKIGNLSPVKMWGRFIQTIRSSNSLYWASRNIKSHYDFSNEFFSSFLDSTMTYSAGIFESTSDTLQDAQVRKLDRMLSRGAIKHSDHILDIGCGWGGLSLQIAKDTGAQVKGITLSENQLATAQKRAQEEGLNEKVHFSLQDYRLETNKYDRIVSVGMFEHVGLRNFNNFFKCSKNLLKDDGLMLIHSIGSKYPPYGTNPWIKKYIFPGGFLPSINCLLYTSDAADE